MTTKFRSIFGTVPERLFRDTRGVVLILVALLLPVMVGLTGLGVETGLWYAIKRQNQAAADEAAISGAMEVAAGAADVAAQAICTARWNGFNSSVSFPPCPNALAGVTVNVPPTSGAHSGTACDVEVILSQQQSTIFANINPINLANVTITTRAVAGPTQCKPACVLALSQSGIPCGGNNGVDVCVSGNTQPDLTGCSVDTNSNSASSVTFNDAPSHLTAYTIVTSGNINGIAHTTLTTPATTNAAPTADPYANAMHPMPAPCLPGTSITTPALPANNGCYSSISITGNAVLPSNSVFYVAGGLFSITGNGTVTGNQVTIVLFNNASINIAGNSNVQLTAPTAGTWKGILFWQDKDKASTPCPPCTSNTIQGTAATSFLTGALYFPNGNFTYAGNNTSDCAVLIANTITFQGNPGITPNLRAGSCAAAGVTPPSNGSGAIALLE